MERRFKIMYIRTGFLSTFLNWRQGTAIQLPVFPQLPDDVEFTNITFDFARQAISVIMYSKEFEIVPDGFMPPVIDQPLEYQTIQLQVVEDSPVKLAGE